MNRPLLATCTPKTWTWNLICNRLSRCYGYCAYRLAQWPALPNRHLVALLHTERWAHMSRQVLMPLLVSRVLWDVVEVLAADDEGTMHLCRYNGAGEDTATYRDEACEGAFLVCIKLAC